jgi:hypothetical protein
MEPGSDTFLLAVVAVKTVAVMMFGDWEGNG